MEEHERCEQQMEAIRMRLEAQATEVHNIQLCVYTHVAHLFISLFPNKASIARMQRSIQEKAIQNRIMEKVCLVN